MSYGVPGSIDLIEYYSAFKLAWSGLNPYDPALMLDAQRALGFPGNVPILMFNPPWVLILLAPILILPFDLAIDAFLYLKIFLYAVLAGMLWSSHSKSPPRLLDLVSILLFIPVLNDIVMGQSAILPTLGVGLFVVLQQKQKYFWAGLALGLCLVKPHIVYLLAAPLLLELTRKEGRQIWLGMSVALVTLSAITELAFPGVLSAWFSSLSASCGIIPTQTLAFKPANPIGMLRTIAAPAWNLDLLMYAVPLLTFAISIPALTFRMNFDSGLYGRLCIISLLTSPYGWIFDQSLLIIPITIALACAPEEQRSKLRSLIIFAALAGFVEYIFFDRPHALFWYPFLYLFILWGPLHTQLSQKTLPAQHA